MSASTQCGKGKVGSTYKKRLEQENTATHVVCEAKFLSEMCLSYIPRTIVVQFINTSSIIKNKKVLAVSHM